jgi:hypothetical protein
MKFSSRSPRTTQLQTRQSKHNAVRLAPTASCMVCQRRPAQVLLGERWYCMRCITAELQRRIGTTRLAVKDRKKRQ